MSGTGYASSRVGKAKAVEEVSDLLRKSSLVFSTPVAYLSANEVVRLRLNIPEGCTARVVKNKLMRIAAKDTGFEQVCEMTTGGNFWIFVESEDNLAAPIKYIQDFAKRMDPKQKIGWDQPFRGGVFDNKLVDGPGVIAISKLPTKQELYQRIAVAINLIPTKVGRSIKLVPTKVGRAVKLAFAEEGEGGDGSEGAAAEEAPAAAEAATPEGETAAAADPPGAAEEVPATE
ncbi:unnamed protein product [Ascophyllum nodosum]